MIWNKNACISVIAASAPHGCSSFSLVGLAHISKTRTTSKVPSLSNIFSQSPETEDLDGLIGLGNAFLSLADFHDDDLNIVATGESLVRAGQAWTIDWSEVTVSLSEASQALRKLSPPIHAYTRIAEQLDDASTIEGCTSIGPMTVIPNLAEIQDIFFKLSQKHEISEEQRSLYTLAGNALNKLLE